MRWSIFVSLALWAATAWNAHAHGPQIQLTAESGKLTTRRLLLDGPYADAVSPRTSVYVMPLAESGGAWYARPNGAKLAGGLPEFFSGPGFAYGYGYNPATPDAPPFAAGAKFGVSYTAGLKRWNGVAFADADAAQIEAFTGSFASPSATARTSDGAPFASIGLPAGAAGISFAAEGAEVHSTLRYRLLGNGESPDSASQDGVYLLSLQIAVSSGGQSPSDPFYFVLHKHAPTTAIEAAVASLEVAPELVQTVPEASAGTLCCVGAMATTVLRRRGGFRR